MYLFPLPPYFQVKKEEPQDDHQLQQFNVCQPHLMSGEHQSKASQFVPKNEPIDPPKPSTPLQVQFKDGEPVVDDSLVLLDWCKYIFSKVSHNV